MSHRPAHDAAPTESFSVGAPTEPLASAEPLGPAEPAAVPFESAAVTWGSPPGGADPAAHPIADPVGAGGAFFPEERAAEDRAAEDDADEEPFVPAPHWRPGRLTKVLVAVCLVLAGGLGGAALQKTVDARTAGSGRAGQSQVGTQNGSGAGGGGQPGGFGDRSRASQSPGAVP